MNDVADEIDPVKDKLEEEKKEHDRKVALWNNARERLLPFIKDMLLIGADLSFSRDMDSRLSGDKQKFLQLVRLHRRHGFRPSMPAKGSTSASWWLYPENAPVIWVHFTSTVCKQVKVGTKLAEVPIFETVCDDIVPSQVEFDEAAGNVSQLTAVSADDDIPF